MLFSVKMRSSRNSVHISGAERIVPEERLNDVVVSLLHRARSHSRGKPDFISIKVEKLKEFPVYLNALPVFEVVSEKNSVSVLEKLFSISAVPPEMGLKFCNILLRGASPSGKVMRGAMVVEVPSGTRLEPDKERGVRVSYIDITDEAAEELRRISGEKYTENFKEALTLSTKVLNHSSVLAELCVSDDPDYTTGYVSIKGRGYFRIFGIKDRGLPFGGRVFFVKEGTDIEELTEYLEKKPVIISSVSGYSVVSVDELR